MKIYFPTIFFIFTAWLLPQLAISTQTTSRWFNNIGTVTTTYSSQKPTKTTEAFFHFKSNIHPATKTPQTDTNTPSPECFLKKFFSKKQTHSYVERLLREKNNSEEFLTFKSLVSFLKKSEMAFKKSTHTSKDHLIKLTHTKCGSAHKEKTICALISYIKNPINPLKTTVKLTFYSSKKEVFKPFVYLLQSIVNPNIFFPNHKCIAGLTGCLAGVALLASLRKTKPQKPATHKETIPGYDDPHAEEEPNPLDASSIEFKLLTSLNAKLLKELKPARITPINSIKGILGHQLSFELSTNENILNFVIFRTNTNKNCSVLVINGYPLHITYNPSENNHRITIQCIKDPKKPDGESPKERLFKAKAQTQNDVLDIIVKLLSNAIHSDLSGPNHSEAPASKIPDTKAPKPPLRRILKTIQGSESRYTRPREETSTHGFQVLHFFPCPQIGAMCGYNASENAIALKNHILINRTMYPSLKECILDTKFIDTKDIVAYHQICSSESTTPLPRGYSGKSAIDKYLNYRLHGKALPVGDNKRSILPEATDNVLLLYTQESRHLPIDENKIKNWNSFIEMITFFRTRGISDESIKAGLVQQVQNNYDETPVKIDEIVSEKYKKRNLFELFRFLQDEQSPKMFYDEITQRLICNAYKLDQKLNDGYVIIWVHLTASRASGHWETRCIFKENGIFYVGLLDSLTPGQSRLFDTDIETMKSLLNFQMNDADIELAQQIKDAVSTKLAGRQRRPETQSATTRPAPERRQEGPELRATPQIISAYYNPEEPETEELGILIDLECIPRELEKKCDHDEIKTPAVARATSKGSCLKSLKNPNTKILFFDSKRSDLIRALTPSEIDEINSSNALLICCVDESSFDQMRDEINNLNRILIYANNPTNGILLLHLKSKIKIITKNINTNHSDFTETMKNIITSGLQD